VFFRTFAAKTLLEHAGLAIDAHVRELGETVGEAMIRPTRIYARAVRAMLEAGIDVRAISHITGGGLPGNVPRVLPDGLGVALDATRWPLPPIFGLIQKLGAVALPEMRRTFNMGLGLVVAVPASDAERTVAALEAAGERAFSIGEVEGVAPETEFEARVRFV